ncbi:hypothetical protein GCM10018953_62840 [Streptosporangium nondiastaticum]
MVLGDTGANLSFTVAPAAPERGAGPAERRGPAAGPVAAPEAVDPGISTSFGCGVEGHDFPAAPR